MDGIADRLMRYNRLLTPAAYEIARERPVVVDEIIDKLEEGEDLPTIISPGFLRSVVHDVPSDDRSDNRDEDESEEGKNEGPKKGDSSDSPAKPDPSDDPSKGDRVMGIRRDRIVRRQKDKKEKFAAPAVKDGMIKDSRDDLDGRRSELDNRELTRIVGEVRREVKKSVVGEGGGFSFKPLAAEYDSDFQVLFDPASSMGTRGKIEDFTKLFQDRYDSLRKILRSQYHDLSPTEDIGSLRESPDPVRVIGMVQDIRFTRNGHIMAIIEDPTGGVRFLVNKNKRHLFKIQMINDEVVGVVGKYKSGDRGGGIIFADNIFKAGSPETHQRNVSPDKDLIAAFISDIHIGSRMFLEDKWKRMIKWLNGKGSASLPTKMAGRVKYLVIAGDLVDGIGIYPEQEKDLVVSDITKQYEMLAEIISDVPDHITIVAIPGNHDAVRIAEPQPPLPQEYQDMFTNDDMHFLSNPSHFSLSGVNVTAYHGKSLDDLVQLFKDVTYENPLEGMREMLRSRHMSPPYGMRNQMAPENMDHMIMKEVPDIFVSGHVHRYGYSVYRGVQIIQGGTWQSQTPFQKMMNLKPQPAKMSLIELDAVDSQHTWKIRKGST